MTVSIGRPREGGGGPGKQIGMPPRMADGPVRLVAAEDKKIFSSPSTVHESAPRSQREADDGACGKEPLTDVRAVVGDLDLALAGDEHRRARLERVNGHAERLYDALLCRDRLAEAGRDGAESITLTEMTEGDASRRRPRRRRGRL